MLQVKHKNFVRSGTGVQFDFVANSFVLSFRVPNTDQLLEQCRFRALRRTPSTTG